MVASVVALATINCYIVLYGEKRSNKITVNEVWDRVRQTFFMYLGTAIMLGIMLIVAYFIVIMFIVAMGAASPALAVLGGFVLVPAFFYLIISLSLTFIIRSYEPVGVFEAFMRSFNLISGKWWSTFGLIMVLSLIVSVLSYIPIIPLYVVGIVTALHSVESKTAATQSFEGMQMVVSIIVPVFYLCYLAARRAAQHRHCLSVLQPGGAQGITRTDEPDRKLWPAARPHNYQSPRRTILISPLSEEEHAALIAASYAACHAVRAGR